MLPAREDFPALRRYHQGKPIVYLDSAATTQKPRQVIDRIQDLYLDGVSNVHRAVNFLADEVTTAFEESRETVARRIGAHTRETVFVQNATHGINYVWAALSARLNRPARVITSTLEHHSNLLPWMRGTVRFVPWAEDGELSVSSLAGMLKEKPDLVALSTASNFLGTLQPVADIVAACHEAGTQVLLDISQTIAHARFDVNDIPCDYLVFSGHKVYGPGGSGVLFVREDHLDSTPPAILGGSMVKEVHQDRYVEQMAPHKYEAGSPCTEAVIGLAAALDYLDHFGEAEIAGYENALTQHALERLADLNDCKVLGPPVGKPRAPLVSFSLRGMEPNTVARTLSNRANIVLRSGFLCAQPAHDQLGVGPTLRASFALYNTREEIDQLVDLLRELRRLLV